MNNFLIRILFSMLIIAIATGLFSLHIFHKSRGENEAFVSDIEEILRDQNILTEKNKELTTYLCESIVLLERQQLLIEKYEGWMKRMMVIPRTEWTKKTK